MTFSDRPLADRYQLHRQLATGSFAETWLATDLALDRLVAVKLLNSPDSEPTGENEQFLREARIAASMSHPNIVAVFDAGSWETHSFLVMEWVDGRSLKQEILSSDRLDIRRAVSIATSLLDGLSAIHGAGIIHRDVKPQNIMISRTGEVKLTDFGIARLVGETDSLSDGTTTGSAAYMAPEQAQGLPVTPAADIYAAGVILYEMLTGRLPFSGSDPEQVMRNHISEPVVRPRRINPSIPPELEAVVLRALSKEPYERYQSADRMRERLIGVGKQIPVRKPVTLQSPAAERALPRFAWMAASVTLVVMMIVGAASLAVRDASTSSSAAGNPEPLETPVATEAAESESPAEPSWVHSMREANAEPFTTTYDDIVVQGEITVVGVPETPVRTNRPGPTVDVAADDDEADDDSDANANVAASQPAWGSATQTGSQGQSGGQATQREETEPADDAVDEEPDDSADDVAENDQAEETNPDEGSGTDSQDAGHGGSTNNAGNDEGSPDEHSDNGSPEQPGADDTPASNQQSDENDSTDAPSDDVAHNHDEEPSVSTQAQENDGEKRPSSESESSDDRTIEDEDDGEADDDDDVDDDAEPMTIAAPIETSVVG